MRNINQFYISTPFKCSVGAQRFLLCSCNHVQLRNRILDNQIFQFGYFYPNLFFFSSVWVQKLLLCFASSSDYMFSWGTYDLMIFGMLSWDKRIFLYSSTPGDYMFSWGTETQESVNMTWTEARMYCRQVILPHKVLFFFTPYRSAHSHSFIYAQRIILNYSIQFQKLLF